jgi:hypothetical protein
MTANLRPTLNSNANLEVVSELQKKKEVVKNVLSLPSYVVVHQ